MKSLSLCFFLFVLISNVPAQEQSKATSSANDAVVQAWLSHANELDSTRNKGGSFILSPDSGSPDDRDAYCAFMRTYRMKREDRESDATRPAGNTTCVPVQRFGVKRAAPLPDKK